MKIGHKVREAEKELAADLQARITRWCNTHGLLADVEVETTLHGTAPRVTVVVLAETSEYQDRDMVET